MGIKVEVMGIDGVIAELKAISLHAVAGVKDAINRNALALQRDAKQSCPVDTGRLRASIALRFYESGLTAEVGTNVAYAAPVEFGARGRAPQAFLGPAFDKHSGQLLADVKAAIAAAVDGDGK